MKGYVRKLFLPKGFAFIEGSDQRDYFLHWSKVSRTSVPFRNMLEGDKVTFDYEEGSNGPKALNVVIIREQGVKPDGRSDTNDQSEPGRQGQGQERTGSESGSTDAGNLSSSEANSGNGTSSAGPRAEDQRPGFNNLSEHLNVLRGVDSSRGSSGHDEVGDRPSEEGAAKER